ncbi:sigma-70 family RNA polymerase sigma factor [Dawidia soli]|uniref:Sigma-70 family RNA polymerase sigma factor n=1 Tax=Dawidia soli TaxID=2782352 RepID=A0AAP2D6A0_9BACT|nr:sigma-70 family RNA polymerase sigma factor [Dawidia soli]MBT1685195.1 sigma-70 family RNA polymerase sigma factor [Dawidia soli]
MSHAQTISQYQPMLHTIAYNLVRCKQDAEDIVQETFVRWLSIDQQNIDNTKAYLIRAVTNNCLNHLNSLRKKKEECLDNMAEIIKHFKETNLAHLDLDIDLAAAFKVLHTKLEPLERAVYLLKEVFDFDYEDLQETLDKKKEHCRQLLCRAKKKLSEETSRINFELPDTSKLMESFRNACHFGNASDLVHELKKDIAAAISKKF